MIPALAIAGGVLLVAILVFAMSRRQDRQSAIGLLDRDARKRDRSGAAVAPLAAAQPSAPTAREVELAATQKSVESTGSAVMVATRAKPVLATAPYIDDETLGVTRRQFLNRSILGVFGLAVAGFGVACLGFLWPPPGGGGFGSKVNAGKLDDIMAYIAANKAPFYVPDARTYLNPYPSAALDSAKKSGAYADPVLAGMGIGLVALYQKCVHLGCRVPWCVTSQWFECPCHGSQYNRVGEKKGGPAPRGLDRFGVTADGGIVTVDTSKPAFLGPPIGTNTTGQEAEGPHCR
jgi:cytochrome b6-f complex iron-sulfur subunit